MYKNLIEILKRKGISNKAYAEFLGLSEEAAKEGKSKKCFKIKVFGDG